MIQKKNYKIRIVLLMFGMITLLISVVLKYEQRNDPIYYEQTYEGSKYANIIRIDSEEGFATFASTVNQTNSYKDCLVELNADLDFSEYPVFPVVGLAEEGSDHASFMGTFEGNSHVISGVSLSGAAQAGIFAKVGGIVKNLRVENCIFGGDVCGAIAAEVFEGAVVNCYVDAVVSGETSGAIVGKSISGTIENCVANSDMVGISENGIENHCFLSGELNAAALNRNLESLSGRLADTSFYLWDESGENVLCDVKKEVLESLTTKINVSGKELVLKGYYSENDDQWCFALPAGYYDKKLCAEAATNYGKSISFDRDKGVENVAFSIADMTYQVKFLTAENVETLYIVLDQNKNLDYVHLNKREEIPGRMLILDANGKSSYKTLYGFYGHGNSSWEADKKSYNLKFDSYENLLDMGANDNFALLAGYRMNSLMSYAVSHGLSKQIGFPYVPEYRFVNLYVDGEYAGVYCLIEKIEMDTSRLELTSVYSEMKKIAAQDLVNPEHQVWKNKETEERRHYYNIETNPKDITGAYLLEMDFFDYDEEESRFTTKYQRNKIVMKRAMYSSEEQVNYIADFWQDFEDALFSEDGYNDKGKRYTEYIDMESFAMQWLMYELSKEDSMLSSIYYYKESDIAGDGLIHACCPWDLERSYSSLDKEELFGSVNSKSDYWAAFYQHADFRAELAGVWNEKLVPAVQLMVDKEPVKANTNIRNISWYEDFVREISRLEKSRWKETDMLAKCGLIRDILEAREPVITRELSKYLETQ